MRFSATRQRLLEAVQVVSTVAGPKAVRPVLQNLRLMVDNNGATLLATDLEVAIRYRVELTGVEEVGDILLPVARLVSILRECAADVVRFEVEDRTARITCGKASFRVHGENPEEFPVIPAFDEERAFSLPRDTFQLLIARTLFACAKEKTRFAFHGVRFEVSGDEVRMVATDGKRLAMKSAGFENTLDVKQAPIVLQKGLMTFERILGSDPKVRVCIEDKQVMVKSGCAEVSSRVAEGVFPEWRNVLPKTRQLTATFKRLDLLTALRQAAVLTTEESRSVRLKFEDDRMVITSRAADIGDSRVELECTIEGTGIEVAFNPDYIVEGLRNMECEAVKLVISGAETPALVEGEENFVYIVMPVTLRAG